MSDVLWCILHMLWCILYIVIYFIYVVMYFVYSDLFYICCDVFCILWCILYIAIYFAYVVRYLVYCDVFYIYCDVFCVLRCVVCIVINAIVAHCASCEWWDLVWVSKRPAEAHTTHHTLLPLHTWVRYSVPDVLHHSRCNACILTTLKTRITLGVGQEWELHVPWYDVIYGCVAYDMYVICFSQLCHTTHFLRIHLLTHIQQGTLS